MKKAEYSNDIHAEHSVLCVIRIDKGTVIAARLTAPRRNSTNMLAVHAYNSTGITWCDYVRVGMLEGWRASWRARRARLEGWDNGERKLRVSRRTY
jgi:hypothetical protein